MENKNFVPDSIPADLDKSWHIPRPTLARSSKSSQGSTSSNNSTQSVRSGSLLLTAANLAQIHQLNDQTSQDAIQSAPASTRDQNIRYFLESQPGAHLMPSGNLTKKTVEPDTVSIASSTHFTVVNVNSRHKPPQRSFCRKNQLTILVLTMSAVFTVGIMTAILLLEMRAKNQRF